MRTIGIVCRWMRLTKMFQNNSNAAISCHSFFLDRILLRFRRIWKQVASMCIEVDPESYAGMELPLCECNATARLIVCPETSDIYAACRAGGCRYLVFFSSGTARSDPSASFLHRNGQDFMKWQSFLIARASAVICSSSTFDFKAPTRPGPTRIL